MFETLGEWSALDRGAGPRRYVLVTPRGRYLDMPEAAYQLDQHLRAGLTFGDVARLLTERHGRPVAADDVSAAFGRIVAAVRQAESRPQVQPRTLWFQRRLIPAAVVARMARMLAWTFHPWVLGAGLFAIVALSLMMIFGSRVCLEGPITGAALFVLSSLFHELGHATACHRYGGRAGDIGFGVYWVYPVLYSDVTDAWRLKREQRVIVDLGGVYLQGIFAAACAAAYLATGAGGFHDAFTFIALSCFVSLNPFFRFDGYWVLADLLEIPDLSRQPARLIRTLWRRLRGQGTEAYPWSRTVTAVLALYTLFGVTFFAYFVTVVIPALMVRVAAYPNQLQAFLVPLREATPRVDFAALPGLLASTVATTVALVALAGAGRALWSFARGIRRRLQNAP
jgi:putative peptide zinc metalloprotease protein